MKTKKRILIGFVSFLLCSFLLSYFMIRLSERQFYLRIAAVASELKEPSKLFYTLKTFSQDAVSLGIPILEDYGYYGRLLTWKEHAMVFIFSGILACLFFSFFLGLLFYQHRRIQLRIQNLTDYLKQINHGEYPLHSYTVEDECSFLEDEIYKTVTALRESRSHAVSAKENLAKNMADISHQLKTPLTSLSIMAELMQQYSEKTEQQKIASQILNQTEHLRNLVVALLHLSRMDAGVLQLIQKEISVEELLSCAMEPVLPLLKEKHHTLNIQSISYFKIFFYIGWTAEGIENILKNCSEHTPKNGSIQIAIFQNPIYTEIQIEDNGEGFDPKELPHLFQRFYKGKHSSKDNIGIGLALAKSIIEQQNGEILAENRAEGGARFRIKFFKF